jgi:hypothetical protein
MPNVTMGSYGIQPQMYHMNVHASPPPNINYVPNYNHLLQPLPPSARPQPPIPATTSRTSTSHQQKGSVDLMIDGFKNIL